VANATPSIIAAVQGEPAAQLRQATAARHRLLDRLPPLRALIHAGVTPTEVTTCLHAFALCFDWLDRSLVQSEKRLVAPPGCHGYQPRCDWLPALPGESTRPPSLFKDAAYWGARYVVEGSTQGSRLILERLENHADLQAEQLLFWQHQVKAADKWPEFRNSLNQHLVSTDDRDNAAEAANLVFDHFIAAFRGLDTSPPTGAGQT
jgi:hypothetical protein